MSRKPNIPNVSLRSIAGFSSNATRALAGRGITTARELVALAQLHDCHRGLRQLLKQSEAELDALIAVARQKLPTSLGQLTPTPIPLGRLGCQLDGRASSRRSSVWRKQSGRDSGAKLHGGLPEKICLIDKFQPVRDQGERGTCVAHALVAVREFLLGSHTDLSEQFLYWDCKQQDGLDGPGTYIETGLDCLRRDGVCEESLWLYNPRATDDEGQGPPPDGCLENAAQFMTSQHVGFSTDPGDLRSCLAYGQNGRGLPIVIGIPVFPSWGNAETTRTGKIFMPFEDEEALGGHAVAIVGYEDDPAVPGGGFFIFRNSWGAAWAAENDASSGYGLLPYAYVEQLGCCCVAVTGASARRQLDCAAQRNALPNWPAVALTTVAIVGLAVLLVGWKAGVIRFEKPKFSTLHAPTIETSGPVHQSIPADVNREVSDEERFRRLFEKLRATLSVLHQS